MKPRNNRPMADPGIEVMPEETEAEVVAEFNAHLLTRPTSYDAEAFRVWALKKERLQGKLDLLKSKLGKWSKN